jgi:hypothetical protein
VAFEVGRFVVVIAAAEAIDSLTSAEKTIRWMDGQYLAMAKFIPLIGEYVFKHEGGSWVFTDTCYLPLCPIILEDVLQS